MNDIIKMLEKVLKRAKEIDKNKPKQKDIGAPFCPVNGQEAFFISPFDDVISGNNWRFDDSIIKNRYVFPTKISAQKTFDRELAMRHFWKLAEDLNEGWEPDWDDHRQEKWKLKIEYHKLTIVYVFTYNYGLPHFGTKESAQIAASKLSDDEIKAIFNDKEFTR